MKVFLLKYCPRNKSTDKGCKCKLEWEANIMLSLPYLCDVLVSHSTSTSQRYDKDIVK